MSGDAAIRLQGETSWLAGDTFVIDQPLTMFVNRYRVHAPAGDGRSPGELLAFCEQRRLALREDLRFYADDAKARELFRITARRVVDIGGRYDVTDPQGATIGILERRARRSLVRTTWAVLSADGAELAVVRERSLAVAIIRRVQNVVQLVPLVGGIVALLTDLIPIPYQFDWLDGAATVGTQTRRWGIRDRYLLELSGDPGRRIDRRLAVAMGVSLDALQSR